MSVKALGNVGAVHRRGRGYPLIEIVIGVAVVGILMSFALPAYESHVRATARGEAQSFLLAAAARQSQFVAHRTVYAASIGELGIAPPPTLDGKYTFMLTTVESAMPSYRLSATATGAQASGGCTALIIDSSGKRLPPDCW